MITGMSCPTTGHCSREFSAYDHKDRTKKVRTNRKMNGVPRFSTSNRSVSDNWMRSSSSEGCSCFSFWIFGVEVGIVTNGVFEFFLGMIFLSIIGANIFISSGGWSCFVFLMIRVDADGVDADLFDLAVWSAMEGVTATGAEITCLSFSSSIFSSSLLRLESEEGSSGWGTPPSHSETPGFTFPGRLVFPFFELCLLIHCGLKRELECRTWVLNQNARRLAYFLLLRHFWTCTDLRRLLFKLHFDSLWGYRAFFEQCDNHEIKDCIANNKKK